MASLPVPKIRVQHATSLPPDLALYSPTGLPDIDIPPDTLPETLTELARQEYGERLPEWIGIPALNILAPVAPVGWQPVENALDENLALEWDSPDAAVGWVVSSALPGGDGNILMYGHNNLHASVFLRLSELQIGDEITLRTGETDWRYRVDTVEIIPVETSEQSLAAYQFYFQPAAQAQLTLLSCWPPISNTHRVVVIALPIEE